MSTKITNKVVFALLFPPVSAVEGTESVWSVCVSVCLLVSALTDEPLGGLLAKTLTKRAQPGRGANTQAFSFKYWMYFFMQALICQ